MKLAAFSCQVLTAPKPSQPPTPFAEGGKQLPGEVREEEREEGAIVARSVVGEEKLVEATEQKNLAAEEDENEAVKEEQSERQEDGKMDLLKDIVAVFKAQCSDAAAKGDTLDGPESPDIVSSSEPDSLQTQVKIIIHSDTSPHHSLLSQNPPALIPSTFSPAGS